MKKIKEAPPNLILRLVSVQPFPNGQKVALYFCPNIKQYFSFNYDKNGIITEEIQPFSFEDLENIDEDTIIFKNGSSLNINKECVENILFLYNQIDDQNEFINYITESDKNFLKLLKYSTELNTKGN